MTSLFVFSLIASIPQISPSRLCGGFNSPIGAPPLDRHHYRPVASRCGKPSQSGHWVAVAHQPQFILIAQEYNVHFKTVSSVIVMSTGMSIVTIFFFLIWFGVG